MESKLTSLKQQNENIKQKLDTLQTAINDNDDDDEKQTSLTMTIQQRNMEIAHLQRFKEQDSTPPPTLTIFHVTDHKAKQQGTNNDDNYDDSDHDDHDVDSLKSDGGNANEWISNKNDSMVIMEQDENIKQKLDTLQTAINDNDDDDEKQTSLTMTIQQRNMEIAHLQRFKEQDSTPPPTLTIFHVTDHKAKQQGTNNDDNYDDSDHDDHDVAEINNRNKYDKKLHSIKSVYINPDSMAKEQQQNLIIKLALKVETLQEKVDELQQTIEYLKKNQNQLRQEIDRLSSN